MTYAGTLLLALLVTASCKDSPGPGTERGECLPEGGCDEGLVCASNLCVDAEEAFTAGVKPAREKQAEAREEALRGEQKTLEAEIEEKSRAIEALIAEKNAAYEALREARSEEQKREAKQRLQTTKQKLKRVRERLKKDDDNGVLDDRLIDKARCDPNDPLCDRHRRHCDPNDPLCGL